VLALADCVIELARSRTTPLSALTDSVAAPAPAGAAAASPPFNNSPGQATGSSDGLRRAEQLVLLVRSLQLLSSGLNLATQELRAGRLQPSATVKNGKLTLFFLSNCLIKLRGL
jgi:serine/threonine-protein kinase ULK/ATG1